MTEATNEYKIRPLVQPLVHGTYDAIVLAVAHPEFVEWGAARIRALGKSGHVLYDVKSLLPSGEGGRVVVSLTIFFVGTVDPGLDGG